MTPEQFSAINATGTKIVGALDNPWVVVAAVTGAISAVASAVSAAGSWITAREVRKRDSMPLVDVASRAWMGIQRENVPRLDSIDLTNFGTGLALDVSIKIEDITLIDKIDYLVPNVKMRVALSSAASKNEKQLAALFKEGRDVLNLKVQCLDLNNRKFIRSIPLLKESGQVAGDYIYRVKTEIIE